MNHVEAENPCDKSPTVWLLCFYFELTISTPSNLAAAILCGVHPCSWSTLAAHLFPMGSPFVDRKAEPAISWQFEQARAISISIIEPFKLYNA